MIHPKFLFSAFTVIDIVLFFPFEIEMRKAKNGRSINKKINITHIYHTQCPTNIDYYMYPTRTRLKTYTACFLLSLSKTVRVSRKSISDTEQSSMKVNKSAGPL